MRRRGSYRADLIMQEYYKEKYYKEKKRRQKCKEIECEKCPYNEICNKNKSLEELEEQL